MSIVDDVRVLSATPLITPRLLKQELALTASSMQVVYNARVVVKNIIQREDPRLLVIVGPCSIHDETAAIEYAHTLNDIRLRLQDKIFIVMRTYFEKPRTTTGWRGLINDPHIDGSFDMISGLTKARKLLLQINNIGLPTATEMLDPISPQYISDLVSIAAIGARTTESQTHRALASGLSMPVAFKNSTDGNLRVAIDALLSARSQHSFFGINQEGASCVIKTLGNPDGFVILRGSRSRTNYDAQSISNAADELSRADVQPVVMVDCSHANSGYNYSQQEVVWNSVLQQRIAKPHSIIGMMIESNLYEGKQSIPSDLSDLKYGVSITDACVGWETTQRMLEHAYNSL